MPGLVGHQGKGGRLLGLGRQPKFVGAAGLELERREFIGKHRKQRRVSSAAARGNEVSIRVFAQNKSLQGIGNRSCREGRGSGNNIFLFRAAAQRQKLTNKFLAELFASGCSWGTLSKKCAA